MCSTDNAVEVDNRNVRQAIICYGWLYHPHSSIFITLIADKGKPAYKGTGIGHTPEIERKEAQDMDDVEAAHAIKFWAGVDKGTIITRGTLSP